MRPENSFKVPTGYRLIEKPLSPTVLSTHTV